MKTVLAAVVALSAAAPAMASNQLALSLGVEPGEYTTAQLVVLKAHASQTSNDGIVYLDGSLVSTDRSIHNSVAMAQFKRAQEEAAGSN